jgi:hypothetical protein
MQVSGANFQRKISIAASQLRTGLCSNGAPLKKKYKLPQNYYQIAQSNCKIYIAYRTIGPGIFDKGQYILSKWITV